MWTFFTHFDALCLRCNYVWVQGVTGLFKHLSDAKAFLVRFERGLGKKGGVFNCLNWGGFSGKKKSKVWVFFW